MTNSVAEDIADYIETGGFGVLGTDLFGVQWGPDGDDKQILVMETGGVDSPLKDAYEQPTFQILVRGDKNDRYPDIYARIRDIHEYLISSSETTVINGLTYLGFEPLSNIAPIGKDDNDRFIYSSNYYTFRNPLGS